MENFFIKLSDLRNNANRKAFVHYQKSSGAKVMKQIIGANPLNRNWVEEATNKLKYAMQNQGFTRVKALSQTLVTLYFCDYVLKENQFSDTEISTMIQKAETSYINSCLSYIEQNIHNSNKVISNFDNLFSAVDVISETNHSMAQKYKQMLSRYHTLYSTFNKIKEICTGSHKKLTNAKTQQISSLMTLHDSAFKMFPSLKDDIIDIVKNKIDELLIELQESTQKYLNEKDPSLVKILNSLNNFSDVYTPLINILGQKRYQETIDKRDEFLMLHKVLEEDYPEWLKTFQYYSLPRNKIDETKILSVLNSISKNSDLFNQKFIEIKNLQPSPDEILSFLQTLVNQQGTDSIINYYKIENDLLNAPNSEKKIEEIVRFIKHLEEKISDRNIKPQLKSELLRMKADFNLSLENSIENKIIQYLSTNPSQSSLIHFFDKILEYFYDLNDLTKISHWQNIKKIIFKALNEVPYSIESLQKDYDFYSKLPDSAAKNPLRDKILDGIKKLNEIMPIMVMYKIPEVHNYLNIISEIEKVILVNVTPQKNPDRLIVLDKFTTKNIVIFNKENLKIGRDVEKIDILLKSDWVSSLHCTLDFQNNLLIDHDSTNGTFYVGNAKETDNFSHNITSQHNQDTSVSNTQNKFSQINTSTDLNSISYFNIANAFEIKIEKNESFYTLKIVKVFDNELLSKDREYIQGLFNTEFVWLKKFRALAIDVFTGKIKESDDNNTKDLIVLNDVGFSIIDKENSNAAISITDNEKITTDRFSIYLS